MLTTTSIERDRAKSSDASTGDKDADQFGLLRRLLQQQESSKSGMMSSMLESNQQMQQMMLQAITT